MYLKLLFCFCSGENLECPLKLLIHVSGNIPRPCISLGKNTSFLLVNLCLADCIQKEIYIFQHCLNTRKLLYCQRYMLQCPRKIISTASSLMCLHCSVTLVSISLYNLYITIMIILATIVTAMIKDCVLFETGDLHFLFNLNY